MKKSVVVLREGEFLENGYMFLKDSVFVDHDTVPVIYGFNFQLPALGVATNFERDGFELKMTLDLDDDRFFDEEFFRPSTYCTDLSLHKNLKGVESKLIRRARLNAVSIVPIPHQDWNYQEEVVHSQPKTVSDKHKKHTYLIAPTYREACNYAKENKLEKWNFVDYKEMCYKEREEIVYSQPETD